MRIRYSFNIERPRRSDSFKVSIDEGKLQEWAYSPKPSMAAVVVPSNRACMLGHNAKRNTADGAIALAGGKDLSNKRAMLPELSPGIRCPVGQAVIVSGPYGRNHNKKLPGKLACGHVVFAGAPNYRQADEEDWEDCDDDLSKSVIASLDCGKNAKLRALAFVLMSAGNVKGAKKIEDLVDIILQAVTNYDGYKELKLVSICVLGDDNVAIVTKAAAELGYVDEMWR